MKAINKQTIRSIKEYANWAIDHIRYLKERAYKKYIKLAKDDNLLIDFDQWDVVTRASTSKQRIMEIDQVKRIERRIYKKYLRLIQIDKLPANFNQWGLADQHGWTIAHEAARHGYLPNDFNQWGLATNTNWTIAHEMAARNQSFDPEHRDLIDDHGWSVEYIASL